MTSTNLTKDLHPMAITCLKWTAEGELCAEDSLMVFHRLMHRRPKETRLARTLAIDPGCCRSCA